MIYLWKKHAIRLVTMALTGLACLDLNVAKGADESRFAQMVFPFVSKRDFTFFHDQRENRLVLEIRDTNPTEIDAIERYDESLVRRVLVRDLGGSGVKLALYLRDRDIRAMVTSFDEPFRIAIDLFDRRFAEQKDPVTGMPFNQLAENNAKGAMAANSEAPAPFTASKRSRLVSEEGESPALAGGSAVLAAEPADAKMNGARRRLLQPVPAQIHRADEMVAALAKVAEGPGASWKSYPVYIYRLKTDAYKTGKDYDSWLRKNAETAMNSHEAMAKYAGELFDFGHEARALVAYGQVLQQYPLIFDKDPIHLWKLAEIHLGQGNSILADGYYQALIDKHPDSDLSRFARVRRLDLKAIKALDEGDKRAFGGLLGDLSAIDPQNNAELRAAIALRQAYWGVTGDAELDKVMHSRYFMPLVDPVMESRMVAIGKGVESAWTGFLLEALALNTCLGKRPWTIETGNRIATFFKNYQGKQTEPFIADLRQKQWTVLNAAIQKLHEEGKYLDTVRVYEALPGDLKNVKENTRSVWAIAESYRKLGQPEDAYRFYNMAVAQGSEGPDRFTAQFWGALMASDTIALLDAMPNHKQESIDSFTKAKGELDAKMWNSWQGLKPAEKSALYVQLKEPLEKSITTAIMLKSPSRIVFEAWDKSLSTETSSDTAGLTEVKKSYSPTASTVFLLSSLSARFLAMDMKDEWRKSKALLAKIKGPAFKGDQKAAEEWSRQLVTLAEDYRQQSDYLDAGRIYALVGNESDSGKDRAESLYKSGLLLYRAGKRQEAIDALKKASEDGNNLMYADLAKKRLEQLQK